MLSGLSELGQAYLSILNVYSLAYGLGGALFAPSSGEAAQKAVFPAVQANAWLLFDTGKAKVSPDTVGIPKP